MTRRIDAALARHRLDDPDTLLVLARIFGDTRSIDVQRASANALLRGNYAAIASADLVVALRKKRIRGEGDEVAEAFLRRLEAARLARTDTPRATLSLP